MKPGNLVGQVIQCPYVSHKMSLWKFKENTGQVEFGSDVVVVVFPSKTAKLIYTISLRTSSGNTVCLVKQ